KTLTYRCVYNKTSPTLTCSSFWSTKNIVKSFLSIFPCPIHLISCNAKTFIPYFFASFATSIFLPGFNIVLTFQVAIFKTRLFLFRFPSRLPLELSGFSNCVGFVTRDFFTL
ncbi:hypothetical protein C0J52_16177, partial [Blattella germanica]